jgi:hypothetical protein
MTTEKIWITASDLLADSWRLARLVLESGFRPTHLIGIWRGGAPIGIAVQEFFEFHGAPCDHVAIRTASYAGIDAQADAVQVHGIGWLAESLRRDDRLLLVDDVFDTGRSLAAVLAELGARCGNRRPADIRIACPWHKPGRHRTTLRPDYVLHRSEAWLVFPHEVCGLTEAEIRTHKPAAELILSPISAAGPPSPAGRGPIS